MDAKIIQKYAKYSVNELKRKAQVKFNAYIRHRDQGQPCISCDTGKVEQACHFYSAGHYNSLRFNENNCFGGCIRCNYFLSGNLNEYRKRLPGRIGQDGLDELDRLADMSKRNRAFKYSRFDLIEIIENYAQKAK